MRVSLRDVDDLFARAERTIALLERCRPLNLPAERERLSQAWQAGRREDFRAEYARAPDLSVLRQVLAHVAEMLDSEDVLQDLYRERAIELWTEAQLAESVGTPHFARRARARFFAQGWSAARAHALATEWLTLSKRRLGKPIRSDDAGDDRSLVQAMRAEVGRLRLPFRVEVVRELFASAAVGDGVVFVRAGSFHTERETRRIVMHEVHGHALPRAVAATETLGLFRVASRGGSDDEEGRALLLEKRARLLDRYRKRQLALRHLASVCVNEDAGFPDTVATLLAHAAAVDEAVSVALRAHRGGGLAREIVYLPALLRVEKRFAEQPVLEDWLGRGRIGIGAAERLIDLYAGTGLAVTSASA